MKTIIHNSWQEILQSEFEKTYYQELREFLKKEYATQKIHPDMYHIFEALELTPYEDVKVVILGQDPYHGINQAHGLSFQYSQVSRFRRHYKISTKSCKQTWGSRQYITDI